MHELGIAQQLLETTLDAARREGAARVDVVRVRIGALSGVVEEALRFAFESLIDGTPAASARLEIETVPVRCYCATCDTEFAAAPLDYVCPACGAPSGEVRSGRELNLVSIEVS